MRVLSSSVRVRGLEERYATGGPWRWCGFVSSDSVLYVSSWKTSPLLRSCDFSPPGIDRGDDCTILVGLSVTPSPICLFSGVTARRVDFRTLGHARCMAIAGSFVLSILRTIVSAAFDCQSCIGFVAGRVSANSVCCMLRASVSTAFACQFSIGAFLPRSMIVELQYCRTLPVSWWPHAKFVDNFRFSDCWTGESDRLPFVAYVQPFTARRLGSRLYELRDGLDVCFFTRFVLIRWDALWQSRVRKRLFCRPILRKSSQGQLIYLPPLHHISANQPKFVTLSNFQTARAETGSSLGRKQGQPSQLYLFCGQCGEDTPVNRMIS